MITVSATNRGKKYQSDYQTPIWVVQKLCQHHPFYNGMHYLDPCAGKGNIIAGFRMSGIKGRWQAIEYQQHWWEQLHDAFTDVDIGMSNFFAINNFGIIDYIITNPPYSNDQHEDIARLFLQKSLETVREGGQVIFLLRVNYLGSVKRKEFINSLPLKHMYVLAPRPSFDGHGSDATEYAWMVFERGYKGLTEIKVI